MTVRTRFAPSPTGYLHIGGARTALFSWLYARRHGGQFILRIEDTDLERSTPEAVNAILEGMAWLGLDYDEGPFYQTRRFDRYREVLSGMVEAGNAYRCYCTKERLEELRNAQMVAKEKPRYDGRCRPGRPSGITADAPFTLRLRQPQEGVTRVDDQVKGEVVFHNQELDDLILARADGTPTYNFTVVVDDMDMRITHVIRGDDHLNNTPRQMNILRALGATPPVYAHLPMILGPDGAKLSKRHGAVSVMQYRDDGYLPEALLNYLVRLGWSHGDQEIFSLDEMTALFDIRDVNHSASAVNPDKLLWLNQHYFKSGDPAHVARHLSWHMGQRGLDPVAGPDLSAVVLAQRERAKTLAEMAASSEFFYRAPQSYVPEAAAKHLNAEARPVLERLAQALASVDPWEAATLHELLHRCAGELGLKLGKVAQPLRVALSGGTVSPPMDQTLALLGRDETLTRLAQALAGMP
jgi:glutamyl-tRNA synthetase